MPMQSGGTGNRLSIDPGTRSYGAL